MQHRDVRPSCGRIIIDNKNHKKMRNSILNQASRMEAETISKNGASLKSHTSRGNFYRLFGIITFVVFIGLSMESCGDRSSALAGSKWLLVEVPKSGNLKKMELLKDGTVKSVGAVPTLWLPATALQIGTIGMINNKQCCPNGTTVANI
jgi:hypothetical protein